MNINQRFPPSSPLLNTDNGDDEIENDGEIKMQLKSNSLSNRPLNVYPTPNPSSSIGDGELRSTNSDGIDSEQENTLISSPNKIHNNTPIKISNKDHDNSNNNDNSNNINNILPIIPKKRVSFNVNESREIDANESKRNKIDRKSLLNSKNFKNVLKLPMDGQTINIGRSSNISQFILNSKNKLISRVHASIKYCENENLVEVKCIGHNGINVTIPKLINVQFVKDNNYLVSIKEIDETEDEEINQNEKNRILTRNDNFTNFYMLKNETIKMPVVKGTVIDFRGDLILIEFGKAGEKFSNQVVTTKDLENVVQNKELSLRATNDNKLKQTVATSFNDNSRPRPIKKNIMKNVIVYKNPDTLPEIKKHCSKNVLDHNSNEANLAPHSFEKKETSGGILNPISKRIDQQSIEDRERNDKISKPVSRPISGSVSGPDSKPASEPIRRPISKPINKSTIENKDANANILKPISKPVNKSTIENKEANAKVLKPVSRPINKPIIENKERNGKILKSISKPVNNPNSKPIIENKEVNVKILKPMSKPTKKSIIDNKETCGKILKPISRPIKKSIIENLSIKKINQLEKETNFKPLIIKNKENQVPLVANIPIENNAESISKVAIINNIMSYPAELKQEDVIAITPTSEDLEDKPKTRGRPKTQKKKLTEEEAFNAMPIAETTSILDSISDLEDISNLLINHLAYSRLLQTPMTQLMTLNTVKEHKLTKLHLRCILINHISCIGVIYRQGKDAAGKALDEEYYYIPEKDSDNTRVMLVKELKGSSSNLRSCRKTHKQYFWKKPKM